MSQVRNDEEVLLSNTTSASKVHQQTHRRQQRYPQNNNNNNSIATESTAIISPAAPRRSTLTITDRTKIDQEEDRHEMRPIHMRTRTKNLITPQPQNPMPKTMHPLHQILRQRHTPYILTARIPLQSQLNTVKQDGESSS